MSDYTYDPSNDPMAETAEAAAKTTDYQKKKKEKKKKSKKMKKYRKQSKKSKKEVKNVKKKSKKREREQQEEIDELKRKIQLYREQQVILNTALTCKQLQAQGIDPLEVIIRNLDFDRKELPPHGDY